MMMLLQRGCKLLFPASCPSCHLLVRSLFWRSKEERLERRKQLWAEVDKGYFADLHEFRRTRGKRYEAAEQLCSRGQEVSSLDQEESVRFPLVSERALSNDQVELPSALMGHTSLVLVALREMGMKMCDMYREPFEKHFGSHSSTQVFQLLLVDKLYFRVLRGWICRNLRKQIPTHRHPTFLCHTDVGVQELMQALEVGNTIVGHVYLVDNEGLIRWRAHAVPTVRETNTLLKCSQQLLDLNRTISKRK